ncbi:MAG: hypothetical protein GY949_01680 [Gammaproteobacteria bacterium]|nr:hypothetical protein [Gammaproteobacteria bacterium]
MRETHTAQASIFQTATDHEIAYELKRMSDWLDGHPELLDRIAEDLQCGGGSRRGRRGMTLERSLLAPRHTCRLMQGGQVQRALTFRRGFAAVFVVALALDLTLA